MGLQIMNYRARMIGGSLKVDSSGSHGTVITCEFPLAMSDEILTQASHDR
jgi:signal transduction histidine kinase